MAFCGLTGLVEDRLLTATLKALELRLYANFWTFLRPIHIIIAIYLIKIIFVH